MPLKFKPRWIATFAVVAFPVAAIAAAPETTTEFVLDLWNTPRLDRQVRACREANNRMDTELRDANDRTVIKERLVADLIAGRLSFDAVVRQFVILNADRPMAYTQILVDVEGVTDEEKAAFSVLYYVSHRGSPEGHALPRLVAEYEARFGRSYSGK